MINVRNLTKRYGAVVAVDNLSMTVRPGLVTGFLGSNGAGKSTTMRMMLGLTRPTVGTVTFDGQPYRQLTRPTRTVGALLDAAAVQPFRTATEHLRWVALAGRTDPAEIGANLEVVGLAAATNRRVGEFSLGMRQRLGLAAALLGDPQVLILDEPTNGLDPDGIAWLRSLLRSFAEQGRTVFLSSHLMGEMELTADRVVIIDEGHFVADLTIPELIARTAPGRVHVVSSDDEQLSVVLGESGAGVEHRAAALTVSGTDARAIGEAAFAHHIVLYELQPERATLEEAFMALTHPQHRTPEHASVGAGAGEHR